MLLSRIPSSGRIVGTELRFKPGVAVGRFGQSVYRVRSALRRSMRASAGGKPSTVVAQGGCRSPSVHIPKVHRRRSREVMLRPILTHTRAKSIKFSDRE